MFYVIESTDGRKDDAKCRIFIENNQTAIIGNNTNYENMLFNIPDLEKCEFKNLQQTVEYFKLLNELSKDSYYLLILYSATRTVMDLALDELAKGYYERKKVYTDFKLKTYNKKEYKPANTLAQHYQNFIKYINNLDKEDISNIKSNYFSSSSDSVIEKLKAPGFNENSIKELNLFTHNSTIYGNTDNFKNIAKDMIYFLVFVDYCIGLCKDSKDI